MAVGNVAFGQVLLDATGRQKTYICYPACSLFCLCCSQSQLYLHLWFSQQELISSNAGKQEKKNKKAEGGKRPTALDWHERETYERMLFVACRLRQNGMKKQHCSLFLCQKVARNRTKMHFKCKSKLKTLNLHKLVPLLWLWMLSS